MRIGLDLDGVLYQFDKTAQYMLARRAGLEFREDLNWDHSQYWRGVDKDLWDWLWEPEQVDPLFRHGHLYRGAIEFVYDLATMGDVVVVTKRPSYAWKVTVDWLRFHWGEEGKEWPFAEVHVIHDGGSKSQVKGLDVMIDDNETILEDMDSTTNCILLAKPWMPEGYEPQHPNFVIAYDYEGVLREVARVRV